MSLLPEMANQTHGNTSGEVFFCFVFSAIRKPSGHGLISAAPALLKGEKKMKETTRNALDFADPGPLPKELMDVPGFVNGLKEHTMRTAPRPNEVLAFAGALAMLAHLSGRASRDRRGTRTNLYIAALADTGMGKDEPRLVNKRLAEAVGAPHAVPDSIASGEGLEDAVAATPALLLQTDEADTLFTAMRGTASRASRMNEMLLRFFTESRGAHAMRQRAGDGTVKVIPEPHLTLLATGIPKFFYRSLSEKVVENGLLGRCLFFEAETFCPLGEMESESLPAEVLAFARRLCARELVSQESGTITPALVDETPKASERLRSVFAFCDEMTQRLRASDFGTAAALYVRLPEKLLKLAMLRAISRNDQNPVMDTPDIDWSAQLATHLTKKMIYMTQFYVSEGKFDSLKKRVLATLSMAGGEMSRSELLRRLHVDSATFQKVILTLHMCEMIEEEYVSRNKIIYTLKNAA